MEKQDVSWRKCINEEMEKSKMYTECKTRHLTLKEENNCKKDLCDLCCVKGGHIYENFNYEKCHVSCSLKYNKNDD